MNSIPSNDSVPFQIDDWVIDTHNPSLRGQYTGESRKSGSHLMVQLRYPDGTLKYRPVNALEAVSASGGASIDDRLASGHFGKLRDLQRLITYEKLKGTLHEVVYSMEAAQIDFYPYQFKPVLKFINSPTERLIIADEVGLGKTIESALIWTELQARRQASRLLVVCPNILTEKWRDELRSKFLFDARIVDFRDLQQEIAELKSAGPSHSFVLIASYSGLRPPKREIKLLESPLEEDEDGTPKTRFLRELGHWGYSHPPFDLVIFDEAHYMRNAGTSTFHLGKSLSMHNETGVLCVSATPVNNSNNDLHSLLRLIDSDFFETQGMFDELLEANRPSIQAINALAQTPVNMAALEQGVAGMAESRFIKESPLFKQFLDILSDLNSHPGSPSHVAKAQDMAEKLNLLGGYINRTRRVQVEEERPERRPIVLPVTYTDEEMDLYRTILELVRRKCRKEAKPFHVFRVLGLQLRAASCLPALFDDIKAGRIKSVSSDLKEMKDLLSESVGNEVYDDFESELEEDEESFDINIDRLLDYDFKKNDQKFNQFIDLIENKIEADEKVVLFAFYRGTLAYLRTRLQERGISTATIHGGIDHEHRWQELDRFKDPKGPRILLSSEVGSEGIDLQFCHTLVNYDLPWNPMRIEQRIGRIDRVGQKAKVLSIVNFKVKDTIEERLYERLHEKLLGFANSLGDLESVVGDEVQKLTVDLLSQELTIEEEEARMERAERAIENKILVTQKLEESGDSLVALSDYVQKKIRENRDKGRYIQAEELEDYLADFFEREFPGSEVLHNTPADGCVRLSLSPDAQISLSDFISRDTTLSARPLRQRSFAITFHKDVLERLPSDQRRSVHFINHLSPLIRWVTKHNTERAHSFYNVSALTLKDETLEPGIYVYRVQRWVFRGLSPRDAMAYAVKPIDGGEALDADQSETVMQKLLRAGGDWDYASADGDALKRTYSDLEGIMGEGFDSALETFEAENKTAVQIRVQRAANHWNRLIEQSEKAIETMKRAGRKESLIRGRETRLKNELSNKEQKLNELRRGGAADFETEEVASGIFKVITED
jgi:SNF2 family DNA or RNA helicase